MLKCVALNVFYIRVFKSPKTCFGKGSADSSYVCQPWWHRCNSCLTHLDTAVSRTWMMLLTSSLLHCGVYKYLQLYTPMQIFVYPLYNLYHLRKANHFRLKDESNTFVLVFVLNLFLFVGLFCVGFFLNTTTVVQCKEAFLVFFFSWT